MHFAYSTCCDAQDCVKKKTIKYFVFTRLLYYIRIRNDQVNKSISPDERLFVARCMWLLKNISAVKWSCNYSSSLTDWWQSWCCSSHTVNIKSYEACCELAPSAFCYNSSVKVTIKWIMCLVSLQECRRCTEESGHGTVSRHFHHRPSSHCCVCVWWDTYRQRRRGIFWRRLPEHLCRLCSKWVHT